MSENAVHKPGYKIRFRVRLAKALNSEASSRTVVVAGREVVLSSQDKGKPIEESGWIVLTVRDFPTEDDARSFGDRLRGIVELVGLCTRNGVDVGEDKPTAHINEEWARSMGFIRPDERIAPNVHGLSILPDDDKTRVPLVHAEGRVLSDPDQFLGALAEVGPDLPDDFSTVQLAVRAMNAAIGSKEALSRMAIAISTVEALGQSETWTSEQKALLNELASRAEKAADISESERQEVADALRRGIQRIGLRQGVMRILDTLGLKHLRNEWDRIYGLRSNIIHGTKKVRDNEITQLARETETLCGRIILAYAQSKGVRLASIAATHFPPT